LKAAINLKEFQQKQELNEMQRAFLNQPIVKFVLLVVDSSTERINFFRLFSFVKILRENQLGSIDITGCKTKYHICGIAYNISPFLAVLVLRLYPRIEKLNKLFR